MGIDPDVLDEDEEEQVKNFSNELLTSLKELFHLRRNRVLAQQYNEALSRMEKDLSKLDKQVIKLTSGDLRIAKRRDGKVKFDPSRDAKSLEAYGGKGADSRADSGDESEEEKRELFNKCFSKKNFALGLMTRTIDSLN